MIRFCTFAKAHISNGQKYMATETGHNNVFHTDYKGNRIRLDNFRPPTVNTNQLLRYLIRESKNMIFITQTAGKPRLRPYWRTICWPYLPTSIVNDGQVMVTALPKTGCMDFIQSWLHLGIAQATLVLRSVCTVFNMLRKNHYIQRTQQVSVCFLLCGVKIYKRE